MTLVGVWQSGRVTRPTTIWVPSADAATMIGELRGARLEVFNGSGELPESWPDVEVYVPPFLSAGAPAQVMARLPSLRFVQLTTAGADAYTDRLPPGVMLCDAEGAHTPATAEWVATVILACVRGIPGFVRSQAAGEWNYRVTGELTGKTVLIVGYGSIAAGVEARLAPFGVSFLRVARTARVGVSAVADLPSLLGLADVVVVLVPLTPATRGLISASFLAGLRDGALLVNGARGPVCDTDALVAELASGRIAAAVDVTDPEPLPAGHPLWRVPGLLLTPHVAGSVAGAQPRVFGLVRAQLERYLAGEPLANVVTDGY